MSLRSSLPFLLSAVVALASASGAAAWGYAHYVPSESPCEGLRIDGETVPQDVELTAWIAERASRLEARPITLRVEGLPEARIETTLAELGVRVDVDRVLELARKVGHEGSLADRIHDGQRAKRGEVNVPFSFRLDDEALSARLAPLRELTDRDPIDARYDFANQKVVEHQPGLYLDEEGAHAAVLQAAMDGRDVVELRRVELPPRISSDYVASIDTSTLLARFETRFSRSGAQGRRARNIEVAASRLSGLVLVPGELYSFNAIVGPRTVENGFHRAYEIFRGEMIEGVGGGTCQVSSTLYAAAFLAGLEPVERLPHSRPLAYIPIGLDATVVYPVVDFKFRNPYDFPVAVHAEVVGNTVRFELYGRDKPAEITFGREIVSTRPFRRRLEEQPGLRGKILRKQHGLVGYTVERERRFVYRDGTERVEKSTDHYPPTAEIFLVPPGIDEEMLLAGLDQGAEAEEGEDGEVFAAAPYDLPPIEDLPAANPPSQALLRAPTRLVIRGQ